MLRILFSFTPFMVCLCWFFIFLIHYPKSDASKRLLTWFLATCVVLYFCHGIFFTIGTTLIHECLWTFCSLSVYPLYYAYICKVTSRPLSRKQLCLFLLPGLLVAVAKYCYPSDTTDLIRKVLNTLQIVFVCIDGIRKLHAFDKDLENTYADIEGRDTTAVKHLLIAFVIISLCSAVANALGKAYFLQNDWLILIVIVPFTILLFTLSYIGFTRNFSMEQYVKDIQEEGTADEHIEDSELGKRIEKVILEDELFLKDNLKINDVVKASGICRTNISNYINKTKNMSFSDYINRLRIEHAKKLLLESPSSKIIVIANLSGYSTEQSFYRNFNKFTGTKTSEWLKLHSQK